eukprot:TRINITY_DN77628_c0_g1_i1.p1 TRINITY_DN77628_c0_g1~~TRINITY_DN77628_c0_g1_i1.p1  ORF type:complete len:872 (+),score=136.43 TRINITY_DN77628_c0_g1_i1:134-2749(+)
MSSDPVLLEVLASTCGEALQLFELVTLKFDGGEAQPANLCIGKHFIYFVNMELNQLLRPGERLWYLDIEKAVIDTSTTRFFILELNPQRESYWKGGRRILVQSEHRDLLLQRIAICWQAEMMYRRFEVNKFPQAKVAIGDKLSGVQSMTSKKNELIKVLPFKGYKDDFSYRGYSFWLREGFKSTSGLKDGCFQHTEGWEVTYDEELVKVPADVCFMFQVDDERLIMDVERTPTGVEDLQAMAMEYQQSLTDNLDRFYVVVSGQYMKKMNRTDDLAAWDGWEFFVRSKEYAFACVLLRRQYLPPLISTSQDIGIVLRCPAKNLTNDSCEVILDECRFVADSIASNHECRIIYPSTVQARLDTLHLNEEGYRWAEGQMGMVPHYRNQALKFVKSIVKILITEGAIWDETLDQAEVFKDVNPIKDPLEVKNGIMSDAQELLRNATDIEKRRSALEWRISRYFAYCVDGGIVGDRFTFAMLVQSFGRVSSDTHHLLTNIVEFLLHMRPKNEERIDRHIGFTLFSVEPEMLTQYSFNELIMRQLISESFVLNEMKKRNQGRTEAYEAFLASLLTNDDVGFGLRTVICRQVLGLLGTNKQDQENPAAFQKTVRNLMPALVKVMKGSNKILISYATAALVNLSYSRENMKQLLVSENVLSLCVQQLKVKHDELTLYTLYLLVNLTKLPHHRHIVVKEGAVPLLVDVLTSSYQNLRKQRILAEVASVLGQLCNDPETRSLISESFPVVRCLLWINDGAQPNTKLKSKVLFALRQLCMIGQNKIVVGQHVIPVLLEELAMISSAYEECATNLVLLMGSLASVNSNALMMAGQFEAALVACGIQKGQDGTPVKNNKLATRLWPKLEDLKQCIKEAKAAAGD